MADSTNKCTLQSHLQELTSLLIIVLSPLYYTTNKTFEMVHTVVCGFLVYCIARMYISGQWPDMYLVVKLVKNPRHACKTPMKAISISSGFEWGQVCTVRW